jgi:hypothetical protein
MGCLRTAINTAERCGVPKDRRVEPANDLAVFPFRR